MSILICYIVLYVFLLSLSPPSIHIFYTYAAKQSNSASQVYCNFVQAHLALTHDQPFSTFTDPSWLTFIGLLAALLKLFGAISGIGRSKSPTACQT